MSKPLRIGIAGLGTVGAGTLKLLGGYGKHIAERAGRDIAVTAISSRDRSKNRGTDISRMRWVADPLSLTDDADVDVVVETIGGAGGVAYQLVEKALTNGKSVVTANKALIAQHGVALARIAEKTGAVLAFEAAVAGGIPIIKTLREGLAANRFRRIVGILNGTCNYILTLMAEEKRSFVDVLTEAQEKGYAEADPSFDVDGTDTAHKLAILTSLAFGVAPAIDKIHIEGIRRIGLSDIEFAANLGYAIRLLGITTLSEQGILQRVHPAMVPINSPLAGVRDVYNAVLVEGDIVGNVFLEGKGAGEGPTASSIVADIIDIARGASYKPFTLPVAKLKDLPFGGMEDLTSSYYLRLIVADKPGVLAEITASFRVEDISLHSFTQHAHTPGKTAQLVLTTHDTTERAMLKAVQTIAKLDSVKEPPYMIRIENN